MMRRILLILFFLALIVTACGGDGEAVPTMAPTVSGESLGEDGQGEASPRIEASTAIPPTWTPQSPAAQVTPAPASGDADAPPSPAPDSAVEGDVYVVQEGDTLAEIAESFGVALDVLVEANGIQNIDHIEVGQELLIPQQ